MPKNGKGKAKTKDADSFRYNLLRGDVKPWTSKLFRDQHLLFPDAPDRSATKSKMGARDVAVSTAIVADRASINKIVKMMKLWNGDRTADAVTGKIETSATTFPIVEWHDGQQASKEAYIRYSMVQDNATSRWILHHLDGTETYNSTGTKGEWLNEGYDSSGDDDFYASGSDIED